MNSLDRLYVSKELGYFDSVRIEIQPLLPEKMDKVFEVGCGAGGTLQWLKSEYGCSWVGGVELIEDPSVKAKERLDFFMEGNIEKIEFPIENDSIDLILCLDILEHLIDPWLMVHRLSLLLKPGGVLIASLPNICHHTVLLPLLLNDRWDYKPSGILDKTHLRFFTRKTAIELLEGSERKMDKIEPVILISKGLKLFLFEWIIDPCTFHILRNFFVTQYMIRVKK